MKIDKVKKIQKTFKRKTIKRHTFFCEKNLHLVKFVVFAINFAIFKRAIVCITIKKKNYGVIVVFRCWREASFGLTGKNT